MNSKQSTPASAVAALQQEIRIRTEVIRTLADLREQLDADRICGSWLSAENNLSVSIRRIGEGTWRILVLDPTLCYKRIVQDATVSGSGPTRVTASFTTLLPRRSPSAATGASSRRTASAAGTMTKSLPQNLSMNWPNNGTAFGISRLPRQSGAALRRTPHTVTHF